MAFSLALACVAAVLLAVLTPVLMAMSKEEMHVAFLKDARARLNQVSLAERGEWRERWIIVLTLQAVTEAALFPAKVTISGVLCCFSTDTGKMHMLATSSVQGSRARFDAAVDNMRLFTPLGVVSWAPGIDNEDSLQSVVDTIFRASMRDCVVPALSLTALLPCRITASSAPFRRYR